MLNTLQKKYSELRRSDGFTIIEVMIVLAIAGLIMVIVFMAIPQLQRNQRNTATREVVNRIKAEVENYASNNNGNYPRNDSDSTASRRFGSAGAETAPGTPALPGGTFSARYLSTVNIPDPRSGLRIGLASINTTTAPPAVPASGGRVIQYHHTNGTGNGFLCDGENVVTGSGARSYALTVTLEGGAVYCVDNR